jgi:hypothetical protein
LDVIDQRTLRAELEGAVAHCGANATIVLIPKREVEAWLLYDPGAIAAAFRERSHARLPGNPESLSDPKRYLRDLVWRKYRKEYLNTIHNAVIARHVDLLFLQTCRSFSPHIGFARNIRTMLHH